MVVSGCTCMCRAWKWTIHDSFVSVLMEYVNGAHATNEHELVQAIYACVTHTHTLLHHFA